MSTTPPRPEAVEAAQQIWNGSGPVCNSVEWLTTIISTAHSKLYAENEALRTALTGWYEQVFTINNAHQRTSLMQEDWKRLMDATEDALTTSKERKG